MTPQPAALAAKLTARIPTLKQWSEAKPDELLHILETQAYPLQTGKDGDSVYLVDHLWALHRDELTPARQSRLRALVDTDNLSPAASFNVNAYCLALQGESTQLVQLWRSEFDARVTFAGLFVLMECFRHVKLQDLTVINEMIDMIDQPTWLFWGRLKAAVTVACLRPGQQTNAAEVIRKVVHNNTTPEIIATRERALQQLATDPALWSRCEYCCYGNVHSNSIIATPCPVCLGFGTILG
jgi:hypothetical protein